MPVEAAIPVKNGADGYSKTLALPSQDRLWSHQRKKLMMFIYFLGSVIIYACRTAMSLCMPEMYDEFGWDKKQQGLVMACFLWGYPVTQILGGYLADRFGAERVIITVGILWASITFATPDFPHLGSGTKESALALIIFSRLSQGLLQGMHFPSVMSATGQHVSDKDRTFVYSVISSGTHGGIVFSGLFGSLILHLQGWPSVFRFAGLIGLGWVYLLYINGDIKNNPSITVETKGSTSDHSKKDFSWHKVLSAPAFWAMLAGHFANGYTYFVFLFWMPTFFHEKYPTAQPWVYNVLPWVISMCTSVMFGSLGSWLLMKGFAKTLVRKGMNVFGMLLFGVCLICVSYVSSYEGSLLLFCVICAGQGAYQSSIIMNPSDILPEHTGFAFGLMNMFGAIPGFIGTYVSGAILEATGNWDYMYAVTGWVSIVGWAIFAYWGSAEPII
ncbi:voltage-gated purine nucleotide uniporter SLC17A9-like [Watersipora subatra]|uniref:voltage-gated purine nucleotide uniporter SLC17A9-like n=1 Tax=Watersipora subatra TaxID=2589382 RepID=UPI00355BD0F4